MAQKPLLSSQVPQMPMVGGPWGHWTDIVPTVGASLAHRDVTGHTQGPRLRGPWKDRVCTGPAPVHCYLVNGQPRAAPAPAEWPYPPPETSTCLEKPCPLQVPPSCLAVLAICLQEWLPLVLGEPETGQPHPLLCRCSHLGQREQVGLRGQTQWPIPTRFLPQHPPLSLQLGTADCSSPPAHL